MTVNLLILTARFLDNRYHGLLTKKGPPEWPPSPYRLFQALVSGVARRGELVEGEDVLNNKNLTPIGQALDWLQRYTSIHPPVIIAPKSKAYQKGDGVIRFVPNNDDETHLHPELHRVAKPTIPTLFLLEPDQKPEVHYVWDISDAPDAPVDHIRDAARSVITLGWGIDMAFADARTASQDDVQQLKGVRWYPKPGDGSFEDTLRVPTYDAEYGECTLSDLRHCHSTAINRIEHGKPLKTVDKPKVFDRVLYTSTERQIGRPSIFFRLVDNELEPTRYPQPLLAHIAAVVRHAAIDCMKKDGSNAPRWIDQITRAEWAERFVRGLNRPPRNDHQQISYVPLPSIGHGYSDAMIRNVMLVAPIGCERELEYVAARLGDLPLEFKDGQKNEPEDGEPCDRDMPSRIALPRWLQRFNPLQGKFINNCYLGRSKVWQSVTPVILDEHIDQITREMKDGQKIKYRDENDFIRLIKLALQRAGVETPCRFSWQTPPFFRNCLSAHRYDRNKHPNFVPPKRLDGKTAVHLRLVFDHDVPGPITLGAGRHCGFGLMARLGE